MSTTPTLELDAATMQSLRQMVADAEADWDRAVKESLRAKQYGTPAEAEAARQVRDNALAYMKAMREMLPAAARAAPGPALLAMPTSTHTSLTSLDSAPRALMRNGKNKVEATLENLASVLQTQETMLFGFDEFHGRIMVAPAASRAWQALTETDMIRLRESLARVQDFAPISKDLMRDALDLVAERSLFDSAMVWLNGLTWDGVPRVERFLATHFGTIDDEYTRAVGFYMWTGLAGRVLSPGCQLDMVIALLAKQGTKKSTGLASLAPFPECFSDSLSLHVDDADFKRLIRGKIIVEIAELAGLSKGDVNVVKRVITRRKEEWIEKWQKLPTSYLRRCMLFASTNEEKFLPPDETGQRRWLPVEVTQLDRDQIAADREQLWAEGAVIWRVREMVEAGTGVMFKEAERLAEGRHQKHERTDVWQHAVEVWLKSPPIQFGPNAPKVPPCQRPLTLSEVLKGAIGLDTAHQDARAEKRIGAVLRLLGYESKTVSLNGEKPRRWVGPEYKGG